MSLPTPDLDFLDECKKTFLPEGSIKNITIDELLEMARNGKIIKFIDSRFWYEYRGGHVVGAINITTIDGIYTIFKQFEKLLANEKPENVVVAFYCEFSSARSPRFAQVFKNYDRELNPYPKSSFPNTYIIYGGFKEIFRTHPEICFGRYVSMRDPEYEKNNTMRKCHTFYTDQFKAYDQRKKSLGISYSQPVLRLWKHIFWMYRKIFAWVCKFFYFVYEIWFTFAQSTLLNHFSWFLFLNKKSSYSYRIITLLLFFDVRDNLRSIQKDFFLYVWLTSNKLRIQYELNKNKLNCIMKFNWFVLFTLILLKIYTTSFISY